MVKLLENLSCAFLRINASKGVLCNFPSACKLSSGSPTLCKVLSNCEAQLPRMDRRILEFRSDRTVPEASEVAMLVVERCRGFC